MLATCEAISKLAAAKLICAWLTKPSILGFVVLSDGKNVLRAKRTVEKLPDYAFFVWRGRPLPPDYCTRNSTPDGDFFGEVKASVSFPNPKKCLIAR